MEARVLCHMGSEGGELGLGDAKPAITTTPYPTCNCPVPKSSPAGVCGDWTTGKGRGVGRH